MSLKEPNAIGVRALTEVGSMLRMYEFCYSFDRRRSDASDHRWNFEIVLLEFCRREYRSGHVNTSDGAFTANAEDFQRRNAYRHSIRYGKTRL